MALDLFIFWLSSKRNDETNVFALFADYFEDLIEYSIVEKDLFKNLCTFSLVSIQINEFKDQGANSVWANILICLD